MAHPSKEGSTIQPVVIRHVTATYAPFTAVVDNTSSWPTNFSGARTTLTSPVTEIEATAGGQDETVFFDRVTEGIRVNVPGLYRVTANVFHDQAQPIGVALIRQTNSTGTAILQSDVLFDGQGLAYPAFGRMVKETRVISITDNYFRQAGSNRVRFGLVVVNRNTGTLNVQAMTLSVTKIASTY